MLIKITKPFGLRDFLKVTPGQVVDATPNEAAKAFKLHRAVPATEADQAEAAKPATGPSALAAQDAKPQQRKPGGRK